MPVVKGAIARDFLILVTFRVPYRYILTYLPLESKTKFANISAKSGPKSEIFLNVNLLEPSNYKIMKK